MGKIIVAGIGPGSEQDITPAVIHAVSQADVVVGYKYYFRFIEKYLKEGAECIDSGMRQETDRARQAIELALQGKTVCVISSGDSGIYGMAPLLYQMRSEILAHCLKSSLQTSATPSVDLPYSQGSLSHGSSSLGSSSLGSSSLGSSSLGSSSLGSLSHALPSSQVSSISEGSSSSHVSSSQGLSSLSREDVENIVIETLPGISAFQKAASLLGAPIGHDICIISLSDLMTPWNLIERRIRAAAQADFITAVYNPKSHGRYWQLYRLVDIFLEEGRSPDTPVGCVRQAGRDEQKVWTTTLSQLNPEDIDMFTVLIIGNSQTYFDGSTMITPRGYYSKMKVASGEVCSKNKAVSSLNADVCGLNHNGGVLHNAVGTSSDDAIGDLHNDVSAFRNAGGAVVRKIGQDIMHESFRTIEGELKGTYPLGHKWALLHAIHTTADFEMEDLLYTDENAVERIFEKILSGQIKTIVTDVTMAATGIRKGALARLGIEAKCYLMDSRVPEIQEKEKITRAQAGIRLAVEEHPDALFAFGNAPTALMELCGLIRQGKAHPSGIIGAPVGFVNVVESKYMLLPFRDIPKIIVKGRKGGSNLAATLCNACLTFDDAKNLNPGRDL